MARTKNEKVLSKRREKKREEKKERDRELNTKYLHLINNLEGKVFSFTTYIEERYPKHHRGLIKIFSQDKDFLRVEKRRINMLMRVRDLIPEDRLEEVLEYKEFLENLL